MFSPLRTALALIVLACAIAFLLHSDDQKSAQAQAIRLDESPAKSDDKKDKDDKSPKSDDKSDKKSDDSEKKPDDKKPGDEKPSDTKSTDSKSKSDKPADAKPAEKEKPAANTYTVKKEAFRVELPLSGVFESKKNSEITIHPESWPDWTVKTAVEQGASVKKGETLLEFDATKIDEQIRDLEADRKLAQLSLDQLGSEIHLLEQSMPLDLKMAERSSRLAADDLNRFTTQDRELIERQAKFQVKMTGNYLDYTKEELKQLEKMYKGDDITKETEEIVLKRTRDQVEAVQFSYDIAKIALERTLNIELPRREDALKLNADRTALDLQKSRTSLPITLDKQRLELEKKKFERDKANEKLTKLTHDRDLMKVASPADGVVYFGSCTHGQWTQAAQMMNKLRKGGRVSPDEIVLTLVDPSTVFARATIPEKDLWQMRRGLTGSATPEGFEEMHLPASLDEFSLVPAPEGKYFGTVLVDFARLKDTPMPSPGMNCKVKLTAYSTDTALTLPAKALQTDKQNDDQRYVWLSVSGSEKPVRRNVTVGRRTRNNRGNHRWLGRRRQSAPRCSQGRRVMFRRFRFRQCILLVSSIVLLLQMGPARADSAVADPKPQSASPVDTPAAGDETRPTRADQPAEPVSAPPRDPAAVEAAIQRGIHFLLTTQNEDGSWGSPNETTGMDIYAPVPSAHQAFHAAVTALGISALIEVGGDSKEVQQALDRAEAWLFENLPHVRRANGDALYNVWTHCYAVSALAHMVNRHAGDSAQVEKIKQLITDQIGMLQRYQCVDGGWNYYDFRGGTQLPAGEGTSFCGATGVIALHEAKEVGVDPPQRLVDRALASIRRQQKPDFTYMYGEQFRFAPMHLINRPAGSLGRSQVCNLALRLWGDTKITDDVLNTWLDKLFDRNLWLDLGRKRPIPHESYFFVAGYFYYFGHYYASRCVELLPEADRSKHYDQLAQLMIPRQEKDGSWWDFPLYGYHKPYGTAFALMTLGHCRVSK